MTIHIPQNFYKETIAQDWPIGTGNFYVTVKPTQTTGYLTLSPASSTLREIVYYSAVGTDGTGDYVTISDAEHRGMGGTTEQTHVIGEPIRMNVGAETVQEISDAIASVVAGGALDADTTTKGITKLNAAPTSPTNPIAVSPNGIIFETTAGATHSLTTVAGEKVIVWAKGSYTGSASSDSINLKYNAVTKDTVTVDAVDSGNEVNSFALMYTETPGAGTHDITVTSSTYSLSNVVIMVIKIKTQ